MHYYPSALSRLDGYYCLRHPSVLFYYKWLHQVLFKSYSKMEIILRPPNALLPLSLIKAGRVLLFKALICFSLLLLTPNEIRSVIRCSLYVMLLVFSKLESGMGGDGC